MSRRKPQNPLELLTEQLADHYVELVQIATETIAPHRPWWHAELSAEAQLYRYMEIRDDIISWLVDVSDYMPWQTTDDMLHGIEALATERIEGIIPPALLVDERADALKELVQAAGPKEAQKHVVKMERMALRREVAQGLLEPPAADRYPTPTAGPGFPEPAAAGSQPYPVG